MFIFFDFPSFCSVSIIVHFEFEFEYLPAHKPTLLNSLEAEYALPT